MNNVVCCSWLHDLTSFDVTVAPGYKDDYVGLDSLVPVGQTMDLTGQLKRRWSSHPVCILYVCWVPRDSHFELELHFHYSGSVGHFRFERLCYC